jgi:hypothetical protein
LALCGQGAIVTQPAWQQVASDCPTCRTQLVCAEERAAVARVSIF